MLARLPSDQSILREGGAHLGRILAEVAAAVRPGVAIRDLDVLAEARIRAVGGAPAFKGYQQAYDATPFPGTL